MKSIKFMVLIGVLALLPLVAGGGMAQTADPGEVASPDDTVPAATTYQGVLTDPDGTPLNGTYDLEFTIWTDDTGGSRIGPIGILLATPVTNGLVTANVALPPDDIYGQELWLRIRVRQTGTPTYQTLSPRVQVLPTTYAMTVRPGARSQGSVAVPNAIVMATNTSSGWGLRGESTNPTGYGIYGYNGSPSASAYGGGVLGRTQTDGYGVRGEAPSTGDFSYGGYFTGRVGVRAYARGSSSNNGYAGYFLSQNYRGIYSLSVSNWYDAYFAGGGGIYSGGGYFSMRADRIVAVNGGGEPLETGDVVAISGVAEPLQDGGEPMLAVRRASGAADTAVVGVVVQAMRVQEVESPEDPQGQPSVDVEPAGGDIPPGGYLALVTHGLVPAVKVSATDAKDLRVGELLSTSAAPGRVQRAEAQSTAGTILGKVAGSYDPETGTLPVFITLD